MELDCYLYTNQCGRSHNEDSADYSAAGGQGIFLVADGLGGHLDGDQASALVVSSMMRAWSEESGDLASADCRQWLEEALRQANQQVLEAQEAQQTNMKSTAAALVLREDCAAWAHVGDTRVYHLTGGDVRLVTRDHSVTYKKFLAGEITRNEINFDEDRSSLLRVVGDKSRCIPASGGLPEGTGPAPGDAFLLCTDGFWEYLFDEEILIDRLKAETPRDWAELMLVRAMTRMQPGSDNLTLLTVFVR